MLNWTSPGANQTGFSIFRSLDGVNYVAIGSAPGAAISFQDNNLFPMTTYWYEVFSTNSTGLSVVPSNAANATTLTITWAALSPGGTPPVARWIMSGILDTATRQMLVFSGDDGIFPPTNKETWALNLPLAGSPSWASISAGPATAPRQFYSLVYLAGQGGVLFGGTDGSAPSNQTWILNPSTGWSVLTTAGTPPSPRLGHIAILVGQKMYVFGGQNANAPPNNLMNDLYVLDFSLATPTWSTVSPGGTPPSPRGFHAGIFDSANDQLVIFGGQDEANNSLNDTWTLGLSGAPTWTPLAPGGIPPTGRYGVSAVYNSTTGMMVVFGGVFTTMSGNDVWLLSLSGTPVWKQATPAGSIPPGRGFYAAVFDSSKNKMVIFGGGDIATFPTTLYNTVYALSF